MSTERSYRKEHESLRAASNRARNTALRLMVGENVRRLRDEAGLTLDALANHLGFGRQYLNDFENGKHNPTVAIVFQLANALGVRPEDIVTPPSSG